MALRDIFDKDPRSKEQLRAELEALSQSKWDLSIRVSALSAESKAYALEAQVLREKLQSEGRPEATPNHVAATTDSIELATAALKPTEHTPSILKSALSEATAAQDPAKIEVSRYLQQAKRIWSKADTNGKTWQRTEDGLLNVDTNEQIGNANLFEKVGGLPGFTLYVPTDRTFFIHKKDVNDNFLVQVNSPEGISAEISPDRSHGTKDPVIFGMPPKDEDTLNWMQALANGRTTPSPTNLQKIEALTQEREQLKAALAAQTSQAVLSQSEGRQLEVTVENLRAEIRNQAISLGQVRTLNTALQLKLTAALPKQSSLEKQHTQNPPIESATKVNQQLEATKAELTAQAVRHNRDAQHFNTTIIQLRGEIRQQAIDLGQSTTQITALQSKLALALTKQHALGNHPQQKTPISKLNLSTFDNEEVLEWVFSETTPDVLNVVEGNLHLMGDGPWDKEVFGRVMQEQGFQLWQLPDHEIAHIVVGRDHWNKAALLTHIEARTGQELRIYSQEMWFAAMATGRDPFDADNPGLLKAFADGHNALQFLIGQEMPWPNVSDQSGGEVTPIGNSELGVLESPMHLMDYRVGKTSPHSDSERRQILDAIFCSKKLPFGSDCSADYRSNWGTPKSAQRLYRMANHIKYIVEGPNGSDYRKLVARQDWLKDLAWLKKTYFRKTVHAFKWPDTRVS